jgi:DUF1680 family protein
MAEAALVELYELMREQPQLKQQISIPIDEQRYLELARFFIEARGNFTGRESFGAYGQDDRPVFKQEEMEGHAVRATLMCAGVAAIAGASASPDYCRTAVQLWENLTRRKVYITGGCGATAEGEAFAPDYVLPNTGYLETCAAIGSAFFSRNMNLAFAEARYVDELERALYNAVLAGVSTAGDTYTYVNPLQFERGTQSRWAWHGCPCCPPMLSKIIAALPGYVYAVDDDSVYVNLFVGSRGHLDLGGQIGIVTLRQTTAYPWEGTGHIVVEPARDAEFNLCIRVPAWCQAASDANDLYQIAGRPHSGAFTVRVNGQEIQDLAPARGYAILRRTWRHGDVVDIMMEMPVRRVVAHPRVADTTGQIALMRGPIVYAIETLDEDFRAGDVFLPAEASVSAQPRPDLLGGVYVITGDFQVRCAGESTARTVPLEAIPYFGYGNRGQGDLRVWIPTEKANDE